MGAVSVGGGVLEGASAAGIIIGLCSTDGAGRGPRAASEATIGGGCAGTAGRIVSGTGGFSSGTTVLATSEIEVSLRSSSENLRVKLRNERLRSASLPANSATRLRLRTATISAATATNIVGKMAPSMMSSTLVCARTLNYITALPIGTGQRII
jgi:hypothetical protein